MSIHQTLFATYANPMIACDSADFDGTNDYMTRGAGLTGAADSKTGIFSAWVRIDSAASSRVLLNATGGNIEIFHTAGLKFNIIGRNTGGSAILNLVTTNNSDAGATWFHVLASWNLATASGHLYVNDASDINGALTILTDDTIDYTVANWAVGALLDTTLKWNGCMAEFYFSPGQYLDFSLVSNRRKFISASGKPVHLGTTGALPTGTAPLVYQHLADAEAVANFATNRGTGGDFTITGTLDTGSDSPSD